MSAKNAHEAYARYIKHRLAEIENKTVDRYIEAETQIPYILGVVCCVLQEEVHPWKIEAWNGWWQRGECGFFVQLELFASTDVRLMRY